MSGLFNKLTNEGNKLFEKGKAKAKEYQSRPPQGQHSQQYPGQNQYQQHPPQGYPGNQQGGYSGAPFPQQQYGGPPGQGQQQHQYGPPQNQYGPPQNQYGPPQIQYGQPSNQQQWGQDQQQQQAPPGQWGPPPPQQAFSPPPIPQNKPTSPVPPPIPQNRPISNPPPPQNAPPAQHEKIYWKPAFDAATPVSHNFDYETGDNGWGNNEKQNYTNSAANSFHHDNRLVLRALVQQGNNTYTSARLTSHQTLSRSRGYLSATILPPSAEGIWPAFWLLPKEPFSWPTDGEVDIAESWNGEPTNHSCLHWGHYNSEDHNKHQVIKTPLPDLRHQPHTYGFAWLEEEGIPGWRGRMVWYLDGRPIMKGTIPQGTRRMEDFRILLNVAMGGTVCQGKLPKDGYYDLVVSDLKMCEEPVGGWDEFERAYAGTAEGGPV